MLPLLLLSIVDLQSCTSFIYIYTHTAQWVSDIYAYIPGSSADKESACDAGDPSLIPESGRCPGKGIGYPFQYSWASLVAQTVKNLPAMRQTWVGSLGWEDPLDKGPASHSSILAWRIPWTEEPGSLQSMGFQRVRHDWATFHFHHVCYQYIYIFFVRFFSLIGYSKTLSIQQGPIW